MHTPGPWLIGAWESGQVAIDGADGSEVTGFISPENAALICAAPEMLNALTEVRDEILKMPRSLGYDLTHLSMIDALIAKATGAL